MRENTDQKNSEHEHFSKWEFGLECHQSSLRQQKTTLSSQYTLQELFKKKEKYSDRFELNNIATIEKKYPYIWQWKVCLDVVILICIIFFFYLPQINTPFCFHKCGAYWRAVLISKVFGKVWRLIESDDWSVIDFWNMTRQL